MMTTYLVTLEGKKEVMSLYTHSSIDFKCPFSWNLFHLQLYKIDWWAHIEFKIDGIKLEDVQDPVQISNLTQN